MCLWWKAFLKVESTAALVSYPLPCPVNVCTHTTTIAYCILHTFLVQPQSILLPCGVGPPPHKHNSLQNPCKKPSLYLLQLHRISREDFLIWRQVINTRNIWCSWVCGARCVVHFPTPLALLSLSKGFFVIKTLTRFSVFLCRQELRINWLLHNSLLHTKVGLMVIWRKFIIFYAMNHYSYVTRSS